MNMKLNRIILLSIILLFSACSQKSIEPEVEVKTVYIKSNCRKFQKVVVPKFKNKKVKLKWGVDKNENVVGLKNFDLLRLINLNVDLINQNKLIIESVNKYNSIGSQDGNSSSK